MTGARAAALAALALAAAGCDHVLGLGDPTLAADGGGEAPDAMPVGCDGAGVTTRQLVIDAIDTPTNASEATAGGLDIDGDARVDNTLFSALVALVQAEPAFDVQPTVDAILADGALLQLLQADLGPGCATTTLYAGEDRDLPVDPTDNFSGDESFRIVGNARGRMDGGRADDAVLAGTGGTAELRLPLFAGAAPIELPLVGAKIRYVVTDDGAIEGVIAGAIRSDVVDGVVVPSFALSLQEVVARDCGGTAPTCCEPSSSGHTMLGVFDDDGDCLIAIEEVASDPLIEALFSPDLDLYDGGVLAPNVDGVKDAVSIGVAFTAVNAFFLSPAPAP